MELVTQVQIMDEVTWIFLCVNDLINSMNLYISPPAMYV